MIQHAKRLAARSPHPRFKHAALVLKGGSLLSIGYNHDYRHAEVNALLKLWPNKREGTTVVSIRLAKDGSLRMALPCEECMAFMQANRVSKVQYSTSCGEMLDLRI